MLMPTCTKYEQPIVNRLHLRTGTASRFCYDVRLDEHACGWRGRGFIKLVVKESVFMGAKYSDDE